MPTSLTKTLFCAMFIALSACGSTGGGDGVDDGNGVDVTPEPPTLFFGATDPAASGNGADFAENGSDIADLNGQTLTVRLVRTTGNSGTGQIQQETLEEVISLIDSSNYGITLDGDRLTFTDGFANSSNGTMQGFARPNLPAEYAAVYRLLSGAAISNGGTNSDIAYFVVGTETNPQTIEVLTGSATYEGSVETVAPRIGALGSAVLAGGDITLTTDFSSNTIAGALDLTLNDANRNEFDALLSLAPTAITGNGFADDLSVTSCSGVSCTSDSQIAGVFFGPDADEIGGIVQLDLSSTDAEGTTSTFTGSGGFTAIPELR